MPEDLDIVLRLKRAGDSAEMQGLEWIFGAVLREAAVEIERLRRDNDHYLATIGSLRAKMNSLEVRDE